MSKIFKRKKTDKTDVQNPTTLDSERKLNVKVVNARDLHNKETFQTSDPYCRLELGETVHKTKHISSNLNPDWDEEFVFNVKPGQDVIALSIWDKNTVKKDVFMGYSFVTFSDIKQGQPCTKTIGLLGGLSGQINLILTADFETSASTIERLGQEVQQSTDNNKSVSEVAELKEKLEKKEEENKKLEEKYNNLEATVSELQKENENGDKKGETKQKVDDEVKRLQEEINKLTEENNTLAENNKKLGEQVGQLKDQLTNMGDLNKDEAHNQKLQENVNELKDEVNKMIEENNKFKGKHDKLTQEICIMDKENTKLVESNKNLKDEANRLKAEIDRMAEEKINFTLSHGKEAEEKEKFSASNKHLEDENTKLTERNTFLSLIIDDLKVQIVKFREIYQKLVHIRDGLMDQLVSYKTINEMILTQLNGKLCVVDQALLDKITAGGITVTPVIAN